jgi:predicted nucleic acid-binding protein
MTVVIVDTDVVSYLFKSDTRGALYEPHLAGALPAISFMTLAELEQWTILHNWGARRHAELLRFVKDRFIVVDSNDALCRKWAEVRGATVSVGRKIETADGWIAATALVYGAPLITHNRDDFADVPGLTVITEKN